LVDETGRDGLAGDFNGVEAENELTLQEIGPCDERAIEVTGVGSGPAGFAAASEAGLAIERK
jgi:hypothetical protein